VALNSQSGLPALRTTSAGYCFNAGRVLTSASQFFTGWLVTVFGSFGKAASTVAINLPGGITGLSVCTGNQGETAA
jgi:hypothetical protein